MSSRKLPPISSYPSGYTRSPRISIKKYLLPQVDPDRELNEIHSGLRDQLKLMKARYTEHKNNKNILIQLHKETQAFLIHSMKADTRIFILTTQPTVDNNLHPILRQQFQKLYKLLWSLPPTSGVFSRFLQYNQKLVDDINTFYTKLVRSLERRNIPSPQKEKTIPTTTSLSLVQQQKSQQLIPPPLTRYHGGWLQSF